MSRADGPARIVAAAVRLGRARGAAALSLQGVAVEAGVSKALVLYHFEGKAALLAAVATALGRDSAARIQSAAAARDRMASWRALARDECARGESALLTSILADPAVPVAVARAARDTREMAAIALAEGILAAVEVRPRLPLEFVGRILLRELDGLAHAATRGGLRAEALEAELDAVMLALLALGD